jgi:hypothetical protein
MDPRRRAIAAAFVANGLGGPSFYARIPDRQDDLDLSDAGLGLVLVGMGFGALLASRLAGRAVARHGSRTVTLLAGTTMAAVLWTPGAAASPAALFLALVAVGAADAVMDIAMNANGAAFERRAGRSVLHGLHAAWSIGALTAGGLGAAAAAAGVPLTLHLLLVGAGVVGLLALARPGLVPDDHHSSTPAPRTRGGRWRGPLVVLAAATVGGAMIEGAPVDWGAVQLERFGVGRGSSSLAFAAFMAGMVGGRLAGDRLTDRLGARRHLRLGMALAAVGLLAGAVVAEPLVFAAGLALAGAGASGFFPLAFSAAGRTPGVPPGTGAATVSVASRVGFLAEPVLVGALSGPIGLRGAFAVVACVAAALVAGARRIAP